MKRVAVLALGVGLLGGCKEPEVVAPTYESVAVTKRDIVVSAQAAGAIAPDTIVEVKSKASGEVLDIKVETGQIVRRGTLLVSIDRRVPENDVATAQAALDVAEARLANSEAQLRRATAFFADRNITEQEFQNTQLDVANARAEVTRNRIALDNANFALSDTDVLAPITGTVIRKSVERGTVISSPTRDVGGGSVLLTMADLSLVQVRTFVDETDIGKLHAGLEASVMVQAFPNRPFRGTVLKIEPQADTIQNVVMFPVLVRIDNAQGLLKPGMSATVQIAIGERHDVPAIPYAALRTERDAQSAANVLGLGDDEFKTLLAAAKETFDNAAAAARDTAGAATIGGAGAAPGAAANGGRQGGQNGARGGGGGGGGGARGGMGRGGASSFDPLSGGRHIVFTIQDGRPRPVYVQTGLTDLDWAEVRQGLVEGDSVLLLPSASMIQSQQNALQRSQRMNSGLPGQSGTTSTGRGGGN